MARTHVCTASDAWLPKSQAKVGQITEFRRTLGPEVWVRDGRGRGGCTSLTKSTGRLIDSIKEEKGSVGTGTDADNCNRRIYDDLQFSVWRRLTTPLLGKPFHLL